MWKLWEPLQKYDHICKGIKANIGQVTPADKPIGITFCCPLELVKVDESDHGEKAQHSNE